MPPAIDPGLPGALIIVVALVLSVLIVWLIDRRRGRRSGGKTHAMGREETFGYFRDFSGSASSSGVREEDRSGRWGKGEDDSR